MTGGAKLKSFAGPMSLVRILIDSYSLLHNWPEVAPGRPRHSGAARDELVQRLTLYRDAIETPITVVFDGGGAPPGTPKAPSTRELEKIYSRSGQTADDVIERAAHRLSDFGEVLVVTDDFAERDTIISLGGMASSCENFKQTVEETLRKQKREIKHLNRRERMKFKSR